MTETLGDLLRRGADAVSVPELDLDGLVAEAGRRQRRRRLAVVATAAAAVGAIAAVSVLVSRSNLNTQELPPVAPPTSTRSSSVAVDPQGTRPLVYADGTTVHVGDKTVEAEKPVAFIKATDDGAVYEAALDGTLWFTDGTTTSVIGTSSCTACPTARGGVVTTGDSGSLVVWADVTGRKNQIPIEFIVYDTSRREEVARIPFTERGRWDAVVYVGEDQLYVSPDPSTPGCWPVDVNDIHPCKDPHLFRFDVASGETTKVRLAELDAESRQARMFKAVEQDGHVFYDAGVYFRQVGRRLVTINSDGDPLTLTRTNGEEVRLKLPSGFTALGQKIDASVITLSEWLDDDHIVVWAIRGGGDLPAQEGDLLSCELPDGICRVAVPRSSRPYVAP